MSHLRKGIRAMLFILGGGAVMLLGASRARAREANQLEILTGFAAKESCSCAFVVEQTDEYCTAFGQSSPAPVTITIDHELQVVTSSFAGTTRSASFTEGAGCFLAPLPCPESPRAGARAAARMRPSQRGHASTQLATAALGMRFCTRRDRSVLAEARSIVDLSANDDPAVAQPAARTFRAATRSIRNFPV